AEIFDDPIYKPLILSIFKNCGLGIDDIEITEVETSKDTLQLMERIFQDDPDILDRLLKNKTEKKVTLKHNVDSTMNSLPISFDRESRGTQILFGLAGAIVKILIKGGILVIDELDSSLHPLMAIEIVKMFNNPKTNPQNAQLLFNTHDTNILEFGEL